MSNETPAAIDSDMFAAVFSENWDNARHIKSEPKQSRRCLQNRRDDHTEKFYAYRL